MTKLIRDLVDQKFGQLTVCSLHPKRTSSGNVRWRCKCACGKTTVVSSSDLRSGNTRSCGCRTQKTHITRNRTINGTYSPEHNSYASMIRRCTDVHSKDYENYGGRGVAVCKRWLGEGGFVQFLADMGPRPPGTTLERIRVNGNYTPKNTRWATDEEQANNKRGTIRVIYRGRTRTLNEWSKATGLGYRTLYSRYRKGDRGVTLFRAVPARS